MPQYMRVKFIVVYLCKLYNRHPETSSEKGIVSQLPTMQSNNDSVENSINSLKNIKNKYYSK